MFKTIRRQCPREPPGARRGRHVIGIRGRLAAIACSISLLTLASCSESKYPLSAIEDAERDERLVGVWVAEDTTQDDGVAYLHIGAERSRPISPRREKPERALMRFVFVEHGKEFGRTNVAAITGRFFVSKIGRRRYANVLFEYGSFGGADKPAQTPGYKFMTYAIDGEQLSVWFADDEPFVQAVQSGALAGKTVKQGDKFKIDTAELTATSEALTAFLKTDAGKKAFVRAGDDGNLTFRRMR